MAEGAKPQDAPSANALVRVKVVNLAGYNPGVVIDIEPRRAAQYIAEKKVVALEGAKAPNKAAPKVEGK